MQQITFFEVHRIIPGTYVAPLRFSLPKSFILICAARKLTLHASLSAIFISNLLDTMVWHEECLGEGGFLTFRTAISLRKV
jgi:hypothetical protein